MTADSALIITQGLTGVKAIILDRGNHVAIFWSKGTAFPFRNHADTVGSVHIQNHAISDGSLQICIPKTGGTPFSQLCKRFPERFPVNSTGYILARLMHYQGQDETKRGK